MHAKNCTGDSPETKDRSENQAHCEVCSSSIEDAAGLLRMGVEVDGQKIHAPPLLVCARCWHQANRGGPEFLQRPAVVALEAEARLLALTVPREFWGKFQ